MLARRLIERKRDGLRIDAGEWRALALAYAAGHVPDYQMAALVMACFLNGLDRAETSALTDAMLASGSTLDLAHLGAPRIDKHSTGGVGDKVSLVLAPLVASLGVAVPMMSGRGLGHTGGTLDKLDAIPGFRTGLTLAEARAQIERIGCALIGQTAEIAPADRKLYALRDATATVESIPLISASIMSKKLAESLDRLVLDVKFGSGAFMKTRADAETLAAALTATGNECGVETNALLTPMDEPLGRTAGNALEVWEAVETLQGRGPRDLVDLTLALAERVVPTPGATLAKWLNDGTAWAKWCAMVEAQGGKASDTERIREIQRAPIQHVVRAEQSGYLVNMDAECIGRACIALGAGRAKSADPVDFAVGCADIRKVGARVEKDEPLLTMHARDAATLEAALQHIRAGIGVEAWS